MKHGEQKDQLQAMVLISGDDIVLGKAKKLQVHSNQILGSIHCRLLFPHILYHPTCPICLVSHFLYLRWKER